MDGDVARHHPWKLVVVGWRKALLAENLHPLISWLCGKGYFSLSSLLRMVASWLFQSVLVLGSSHGSCLFTLGDQWAMIPLKLLHPCSSVDIGRTEWYRGCSAESALIKRSGDCWQCIQLMAVVLQ